ncbi:MAG TPA: CotH kinase family protein, partial [Chitinispirillaceae bacterium]|nr:CotH kinase family protein [Chitinispirillaceae bacterium]
MTLRLLVFTAISFIITVESYAQSFISSNLPIIWISPESTIQDEVRVNAVMKIINRGPGKINYVTDKDSATCLDYDGRISIEIRGSSSQVTEKKQYALTTLHADNTIDNVKLLGLPRENDWILNGMVFDPAKIRDYLCYNLSRQIGEYASRTVYCELMIDGVYKGIYLLQEKIKPDDNRVDIVQMETTDNAFPDITGGYITKADKLTGGDPVAWTMYSSNGVPVDYIHVMPKPEYVTQQQNSYIFEEFTKLANRTLNHDATADYGFPSVIDIPSFIDYMIISELSSNSDAYMYSTYFHKDRNGKLRAGPVWDGDLTFGNDLFFWDLDRSKTDVWQFSNVDNNGSRFWLDLFNNKSYKCYLSRKWHSLIRPGQPLNLNSLESFIDTTVSLISDAVYRDRFLWGGTGSFQYQIADIKSFLSTRINWISANIGSYSECASPELPPLVISKIMYHPDTTALLTQSDE